MTRALATGLLALAAACGGDDAPPGGPDGGGGADAVATMCAVAADCDDGIHCNGEEVCAPGASGARPDGCMAGEPIECDDGDACTLDTCSETTMACAHSAADADGDGHAAVGCSGSAPADDCDDADPEAFPGNPEVCDDAGHDEDCDATTFGDRDEDGDDHVDASCCNGDTCGDDCDDDLAGVHPTATEVCNGMDDDCDGMSDEGVLETFYRDMDGDDFGVTGDTVEACTAPARYTDTPGDCDDTEAGRNPGAPEVCDGIDNDCDTMFDGPGEDSDGDGFADSDCGGDDCGDTDAMVHPGAPEVCDGIDSDCDASTWGPGEDDDGDGHPDMGCSCATMSLCDCDDDDPTRYAGAPELCNNIDENCDGDAIEDRDGDGHAGLSAPCTGGPYPADDCNDMRAASFPGNPEVCDGLDNDCNTMVDDAGAASSCIPRPHSTQRCVGGTCLTSCDTSFQNCNGMLDDGCEAFLPTDRMNCGACGTLCSAIQSCVSGMCS